MSEQNKNLIRVARTRARLDNVDIELKKADGTKFASMAELAQSSEFGPSMYGTIDMSNFADLRYMALPYTLSEYLTVGEEAIVNMRKLNDVRSVLEADVDAEALAASDDRTVIRGLLNDEEAERIAKDAEERAFAAAARTANETARDSSIAAAKVLADQAIVDAKVIADAEMAQEQQDRTDGDATERQYAEDARAALDAARDASRAAAKVIADQAIADAKVIADAEMAQVVGDLAAYELSNDAAVNVERERIDVMLAGSDVNLDTLLELVTAYELADTNIIDSITNEIAARQNGDAEERAFALAARTLNESNRDASIAAAKVIADQAIVDAKVLADQAIVDAKVIADAEMAQEQQDRTDGDAGERAFALQARIDQLAAIHGDVLVNDTFGKVEDAMDVDRAAAITYTNAETSRAQAAESTLDLKVDTEIADRAAAVQSLHDIIDADMLAEVSARSAGDQLNAANLLAEQQSTQTDRALIRSQFAAADAEMRQELEGGVSAAYDTLKKIEDIVIANAATAASDDASLESALKGDVAGDYDTLGKLEDKIQAEAVLARSAEATLTSDLSTEANRASDEEARIENKFDGEFVTIRGDVAGDFDTLGKLEDKILEEAAAARAAEGVLDLKIDAEVSTLKGGVSEAYDTMLKIENVIVANAAQAAADTSSEASRATLAEQGLQTQINNILSNVDPAALDSMTELFDHFTSEDNDIDAALAALSASTTANLNALKAGSDKTIADLVADDAGIIAAYQAADALQLSNLKGDVASDYDTLGKLEDKIQAEAVLARSEEVRIEGLLGDEETRAQLAESGLSGRLDIVEGGVNQAGSVAKAEFDAKAYADAQIAAQEVLSSAARQAVQADVDSNEATMVSEFSAVRGELAQEVSDLLGGASASHNTMKKIEDLMIADAASASADIAAEASLARAEEAKLAADVLALHGRHDQHEEIMVGDFDADAFVVDAASFASPMSDILGVYVNGFKLMASEYTVALSAGAMATITFHVPMYVGDAVCVAGMKKVDLQS